MWTIAIVMGFVALAALGVYAWAYKPTLVGSSAVAGVGSIGGYVVDTYSAFSARLQDGLNVLMNGEGSSANMLLLIGMCLMIMVFAFNALSTMLDDRKDNFTLVR